MFSCAYCTLVEGLLSQNTNLMEAYLYVCEFRVPVKNQLRFPSHNMLMCRARLTGSKLLDAGELRG